MSALTGIAVTLRTANDAEAGAGTDDHLYIGLIGTSGGREFPLDTVPDEEFDDFETGSLRKYALGKIWENFVDSDTWFPRESKPGQVNDPAFIPIEMEQVVFVYLRKQDKDIAEDDDAYRLNDLDVILYGPSSPLKRTFRFVRREQGPWLSNENGQVVYLKVILPGIGAA